MTPKMRQAIADMKDAIFDLGVKIPDKKNPRIRSRGITGQNYWAVIRGHGSGLHAGLPDPIKTWCCAPGVVLKSRFQFRVC